MVNASTGPMTLYQKVFNSHVVFREDDGKTVLLYIDRHLVHEVTSPQAFEGLASAGRKLRRPDCTLATVDHNVPTSDRSAYRVNKATEEYIHESDSLNQVSALKKNVADFVVPYYELGSKNQGIVHVVGPEQGFTLPGTTVVCGDSHTSTHGAFGSLAFGIGTTEVEHVMATQTLIQKEFKNMKIEISGELGAGVTSKDLILHVIGVIGTAGGNGHVIEFCGTTISALSMEARMSICNMAIEAGAKAGMIGPDEVVFDYFKDKPMAPKGEMWNKAVEYWKGLVTDPDAKFDKEVFVKAEDIYPTVTWGTSPEDVAPIHGKVPDPDLETNVHKKQKMIRSLEYQGLEPNTPMEGIKVDKVFIGSCTNSRIEDLRAAASLAKGKRVAEHVHALVVPGSGQVKAQAEKEGLDKIFREAGFDWREAGCSMCLGMNNDILKPKERCASTSNRNFEGRQGAGGRTHLVSPAMAAAAAIKGCLTDARKMDFDKNIRNPGAKHVISLEESTDEHQTRKAAEEPSNKKDVDITDNSGNESAKPKFTVLKGFAAPFPLVNVDTDMIIAKQYLKTVHKKGLGVGLFSALRYDKNGNDIEEFVLNKPEYRKASILICGDNFGCGSSREHAPWALNDFGIRCLIAPSFSEIFFNNCSKNAMLPITLPQETVDILMQDAKDKKELEVDLENQVIKRECGDIISFDVESFKKRILLNGLDDISLTLEKNKQITEFEQERTANTPWLDGIGYDGNCLVGKRKAEPVDW